MAFPDDDCVSALDFDDPIAGGGGVEKSESGLGESAVMGTKRV